MLGNSTGIFQRKSRSCTGGWWISPGRECSSRGSCGNLAFPAVPSSGQSEQGAALGALGVCYPEVGERASAEGLQPPHKTQQRLSSSACFTARSSLEHRSPAGGQSTLLALAAALNSVQGSKGLRERKPSCARGAPQPLALLPLTPFCGPFLRWHKGFLHPSHSL